MLKRTPNQLSRRFGPIRNSELFSSHWLNKRLPLEPEWTEFQQRATDVLKRLIELWQEQRGRVEHYGSEHSLEQGFIQPVLQVLGWKLIYQTHLRGRRPDYALFADDHALDASLKTNHLSSEFWKYPTMLADAKAWRVPLDRPTITAQQREYPPEQIEWYLNNSGLDYAILTNGRLWRLIPRQYDPGQPRFQTYFQCDLASLLDDRISEPDRLFNMWSQFDDFLQFVLFFSPIGLTATTETVSLIQRARTGSGHYRVGVGEGLKQRVFEALRLSLEGFLSHGPNALKSDVDLEECRYNSLVLLYRLLFILYSEDRKLLPYGADRAYTQNRSLGRFRDEIATRLDRVSERREPDFDKSATNLWTDLSSLFLLVDEGAARYKVPPYNGGLFDTEAHPFLREKALPDWFLARIIDQLGRAEDRSHGDAELVRVDYRDLAIQHLGNLYEGLLELQPHFATEDMSELRSEEGNERSIVPARSALPKGFERTRTIYKKGSVYLVSHKGERRATGSYYTPNNIVDYIVDTTIGPLFDDIDRNLRSEISELEGNLKTAKNGDRETLEKQIEFLKRQFAERALRVRILDPAMGSGHFLIRACQYIAEQIATNPNTSDPQVDVLEGDESVLTYWKRRVAESCLYGVDRNFMAVELAKLALWLETIAISQPLTFLDHHFRHGDSLVGASFADLRSLPDAPPMFAQVFEQQLQNTLPGLLATLSEIRSLPSSTVEQVKQKGKLFRDKCEAARKPFRVLADIWCSTFFLDEKHRLTLPEYGGLVERLAKPNNFFGLLQEQRYEFAWTVARRDAVPLHWQMEFPEVFYSSDGLRVDAGFDVVIGNPPYDVLSEKETGRDLSSFREFIKHSETYQPSFGGKNNLYKLFFCRAFSLLREGGRLGFITPMALLGDEQALGIRREILRIGTLTAIEAFPQKDDPGRRVFKDAKLSTVIAIVFRDLSENARTKPFRARVHPANQICQDSPSLVLTATDIPLYDPPNLTVVSCSQADWELAVSIMQSGRFQRLGAVCTSYQGEVNETTDNAFLSDRAENGPLVLRGSNVSMYALRKASQGEPLYVSGLKFLKAKGPKSKVHQSREERIGFQRSSPQNNFRRIVSCPIPSGHFCFDTVSYIPYSECQIPPLLLMALLNSKLLDWYFRLGSTNSKVNEYQFNNLPCPMFSKNSELADRAAIMRSIASAELDVATRLIAPALKSFPFSRGVSDVITAAARRIVEVESERGEVSKRDRALLAPEAQPFQDFIDSVLCTRPANTDHHPILLMSGAQRYSYAPRSFTWMTFTRSGKSNALSHPRFASVSASRTRWTTWWVKSC